MVLSGDGPESISANTDYFQGGDWSGWLVSWLVVLFCFVLFGLVWFGLVWFGWLGAG